MKRTQQKSKRALKDWILKRKIVKRTRSRKKKVLDLSRQRGALYYLGIMRASVIECAVACREKVLNAFNPGKRMHPMSPKASFGPIRYRHVSEDRPVHTFVEHQSPRKKPVRLQAQAGVLEEHMSPNGASEFRTPRKRHQYRVSPSSVTIVTPHGHRDTIRSLHHVPGQGNSLASKKVLEFDFSQDDGDFQKKEIIAVTVALSCKNLISPLEGDKMNNRRANGNESADDKVRRAMVAFSGKLGTEFTEILAGMPHHEYLHHVARHWGVVVEKSGQLRDPAKKENMFVGTAAFNTEMLLLERFADFLIFVNHHRFKMPMDEPTIEYSVSMEQHPHTFDISFVEVKITDLRTKIIFVQRWERPNEIIEKPYEELFEQWLSFLKKAWGRELTQGLTEIPRRLLNNQEASFAIVGRQTRSSSASPTKCRIR